MFSEPALLVEVNLGFAISANSVDSDRTFKQMQDILKSFIDNYPSVGVYYSVLTFGEAPVVHLNFTYQMTIEDRKRAINLIDQKRGQASLDKALDKARDLFKDAAMKRPAAKNILVVFVDKKSNSKKDDVKASSRLLEDDGVRVVIVGVGNEVDKPEVDVVSPTSILTNTTDNPDTVAKEIIIIIDKGEEF